MVDCIVRNYEFQQRNKYTMRDSWEQEATTNSRASLRKQEQQLTEHRNKSLSYYLSGNWRLDKEELKEWSARTRQYKELGSRPIQEWHPFVYPTKNGFVGPLVNLLQVMKDKYDFCYEYNVQTSRDWGTKHANGTWTGVFSLIVYNMTDIGLGPFPVDVDSIGVVETTHALYYVDKRIVYKRPTVEPNLKGFIEPFTISSWLWILLCTFTVGLCSILIHRFGELRRRDDGVLAFRTQTSSSKSVTQMIHSAYIAFFWTVGILFGQDPPFTQQRASSVVVGVMWLLMSFILGSMYKSTLMAMLITPKITIPFDNFEELVQQDSVVWKMFPYSGEYRSLMEAPANSTLGRARAKFGGVITSPEQGLYEIFHENTAVIISSLSIKSVMQENLKMTGECQMTVARGGMMSLFIFSMAFPRGSPLKEIFDPVILRLHQHGLMDYWLLNHLRNGTRCFTPPDSLTVSSLRPLTIEDFYGIFMLYAAGVGSGWVAFLLEIIIGRWKTRKQEGVDEEISQTVDSA
ncbi:glutamate receptor ionotropic, kainate 1-like [Oratosquilla oratoria]|uniref:glutamate receptor ionotropic, kainate 1-like n=1 Tax=Oratosquilla oratoria TaxID=337810 RepID=UPI003F76C81F